MCAQEVALSECAETDVDKEHDGRQASGGVHLETRSYRKTTQHEVEKPALLKSAHEQICGKQHEQRPLHVVEASTAEVDVPRRQRHQYSRQHGGTDTPKAAHEQVQQKYR